MEGERRGMGGGDRKMSRGVNTETGVWQGTMIRFINQPMLFSLCGDCCKTLSAKRRSQCPTTEGPPATPPPPPSSSSVSQTPSPVVPHIPSYISSESCLPFPLFPWVRLDCLPCVRPRWIGLESILSASITILAFSRPQSGVCHPSPLSPQTIGWHTTSNIFSSWSGTEHIRDGSVKVIILLARCPGTIFLHLRASVLLPILWIFYQLLNHGAMIGKVIGRAPRYENSSINFVSVRAHSLGY